MLSKFINPATRTVVAHFGQQIGRGFGGRDWCQGSDGSRSTFWLGALTSNCICSCCGFVGARWQAEGAGNRQQEEGVGTAARDAKLRQSKARQGSPSDCQAGRGKGGGRAGWHSLVVSASKNEKLHVASGAAIVVSNCLGYFTLTIDRNDAQ